MAILWSMHALGRDGLPSTVTIDGAAHQLEQTIKHDFFAATGFYLDANHRRIVVKINRRKRFFGLPMRWIGRYLCKREMRAYRKLSDLPEVPALLGAVTDTGFAHDHVAGDSLACSRRVPNDYFNQLEAVISKLAERGIAYVDMEKPENVILGDDGRPHLIDFQIHFDSRSFPIFGKRLLREFVRGDRYHTIKLKQRLRPDLMSESERQILDRANFWIRTHRRLSRPFLAIRRPIMRWLKSTGRVADARSN
ncbi:MAG TPA: hypothetical protein PK402_06145 [Tepidisphaeraceae bacterium]|nr:hypothetical protein [Tepidisphaeraceae bacterium]